MMTEAATARQAGTRDRLLEAGLRLFAEQGFAETSVGEIEAAAGLKPRRGALYNHFTSKQALLEEAVARDLDQMSNAVDYLTHLPLGDVRAEALLLGRVLLAGLDAREPLSRILARDGDRLPELREAIRVHISDAGYRAASELARRWRGGRSQKGDTDALAVAMVGSLLNFRHARWTFGAPPLELDDERFLEMWSRLCVVVTEAGLRGDLDAAPAKRERPAKSKRRR